ncbi:MAG: hypothetical protein JM58_19135 [Peptococcaceae bacterium BICA1-8]|nr:MAG: hypothetical protein JM58_19135 [Peptococcaceae bacterium BICA1-8]
MKKILVPVDGSELSLNVLDLALDLAKAQGSQITLLTVVVPETLHYYGEFINYEQSKEIVDAQRTMHEEAQKNATKMLDALAKKVEESNIPLEKFVKSGNPAEQILAMAESGYDLIVIGNRGFSPAKKFFLGSVSQRVITEANCPVLVAKK